MQAAAEKGITQVNAETAGIAAEQPGSVQAASAAADQAAAKAQAIPAGSTVVAGTVSDDVKHADSPANADDNDLIEQEWVIKAKAIVERTHDDPYLQNKEINKFKADYIKKRYKREIKVNEA